MEVRRRLAAILAADVVGYSRLMNRDEEGTLRQVKDLLSEVVRPHVAEHKGRVVKTMGDGFLASFNSVFEAFQCALKLQKAAEARNQGIEPDRQIVMRIGINIGDIILDGGDVFGEGVNIAARLEGLASPGGICVSSRAWEDLRKLGLDFVDMGELNLKNIAQPIRAYGFQVSAPPEGAPSAPAAQTPSAQTPKSGAPKAAAPAAAGSMPRARRVGWILVALAIAALGVLATGGVFAWLNRPAPISPPDVVRAELASMTCSWLRITDRSSVDGVEVFKLSGASVLPPDKIARTILAAARRQDADVDQVIATDVAPLYASQCGWIDKLQGYRYAGVPRFRVATKPMGQGVTRADLTVGAAGLGAAGAVYGIDPSGAVERIVDRDQLEALKVPRTPEGDYVLSLDIDHVGWNGVVFMESATPVPKGVVEDPVQTDAERREFERLAQAGRWRFELAWFKVGN